MYSVELTFELADNAKECFYEDIKANQTATLEFQVIILTGKTNEFHLFNKAKCSHQNM